MNLQEDIHDLVLSFFEKIGSEITQVDSIYKVVLPRKYTNYFQADKLSFSFDEKTALEQNCELIIPGSRILSLVISNCISKGPITSKSGTNKNIRYYFFVVFSGIYNTTKLVHIDVNLDTCQIMNMPDISQDSSQISVEIDAEKITPSYMVALDELQKQCDAFKTKFFDDANKTFQKDFELFVAKYDSQIRELDKAIYKKENTSDDFDKIKKFRFDTLGKIKTLEQDKTRLIQTLQEKHKVSLEYGLIACSIF